MVTRIKPIIPSKMQIGRIRLELLNALRKEGREMAKDFQQTTSTWNGAKPDFKPNISLAGGDASVIVEPTGSKKGINKWNWLDQGTRVRRALMSPNWKSKTKPGRLRSGGGAGHVVFISKKLRRPGIKARGWSKTIGRQNTRRFQKRMGLAVTRGAKLAYG